MRAMSSFVVIPGMRAVNVAAWWRRSWTRRPSGARADRISELEDERCVDHRPLVCALPAAAPDATRVTHDQLVVDGRVEDRSQQPVALSGLVSAGALGDLRVPVTHD